VSSPIYTSAKALWRQYEQQLQPLIDAFTEAGLEI